MKRNVLVTGAAGFIGAALTKRLILNGDIVVGIDNISPYYDISLKRKRLKEIEDLSLKNINWNFYKTSLEDYDSLYKVFDKHKPEIVINLAAQAGVRYSIDNPKDYIDCNISGFLNILEGCKNYNVKHLVYASSSSVYGENKKVPFETSDNVDHPISLYAATKKSNELMAHTYGHLYGFKTTGLRFFSVYGPWGRPDMAYYLFTEAIFNGQPIKVFNNGEMERDFTYIDDIINGVVRVIEKNIDSREHYKIYNIGNNKTVSLKDFISIIEKAMGKEATKEMYPMQLGDVPRTYADVDELISDYKYSPNTDLESGIESFTNWYLNYKK